MLAEALLLDECEILSAHLMHGQSRPKIYRVVVHVLGDADHSPNRQGRDPAPGGSADSGDRVLTDRAN